MAKERDPARDAAKKLFLDSGGKLTTQQVADAVGKSAAMISKWRRLDNWKKALEEQPKRKRGAQPGNKNAQKAMAGNKNAQKHGIYASVNMSRLTAIDENVIKNVSYPLDKGIEELYKRLLIKENRLQMMIDEMDKEAGRLFVDTTSIFIIPKTEEDKMADKLAAEKAKTEELYIAESGVYVGDPQKRSPEYIADDEKLKMRIVNQASAYKRRMQAEAELNKVQRSIIKLLDTMREHELQTIRLALDNKRLTLAIAQATGAIEIEPDIEGFEDENDI